MGLYQASFRIRHECPYRELSEKFEDLTIREWYLSDCQVLELLSENSPIQELVEEIEEMGDILHKSVDDSGIYVIMRSCMCSFDNSIIDLFEEYNCLYQPPTVHQSGWENYTVIAFDEGDIRSLHTYLNSKREIEVLSKIGLSETQIPYSMLTPIDRFFSDLTEKQLTALQIALENGYYEQPRNCSVSDLSELTTVSRSTFEEHLRKAENKLIKNSGKFIHLICQSNLDSSLRREDKSKIVGEV